jgi:hypothetical protein
VKTANCMNNPAKIILRKCVCQRRILDSVSDGAFFNAITGCGQDLRVQGIGIKVP